MDCTDPKFARRRRCWWTSTPRLRQHGEGGDFSAVALEAALQAEETKAEEGAAVEEEAAGLSELETELAAAQRELPPTPPAADELGLVETEVADAMSQLDVGDRKSVV